MAAVESLERESDQSPDGATATPLFEVNLAAVKRRAPHLHARLRAIEAPNTELVFDDSGGVDMVLQGQSFYGRDAVEEARLQVEAWRARSQREYINEPDPEMLEGLTGDLCRQLVDDMEQAGIQCDRAGAPDRCHFLIVFGIGLGFHIPPLIEASGARIVVLIEPNLEFLYQSLRVADWASLLEPETEDAPAVHLIVERNPAAVAAQVRRVVQSNNPVLLDGAAFFIHYPSAVLDQCRDQVRQDLALCLSGLGFFEDEFTMIRNATRNLMRPGIAILSHQHPPREEPVFIVGSGPSVDADMDFIVDNADRAVVISIGTGLRGLLKRGVTPDFHVELENQFGNYEVLEASCDGHDMSAVTLLGSLTVHPRVPGLFGCSIFFLRDRVTSTKVYGAPLETIQPAGPTVANAALMSAIRLGFREIFLFGVDMGSKDPDAFHARESVYGAGLRADYAESLGQLPGNFGGEVAGAPVFNWSRKVLENVLRLYRSVTVYNCSDGARIEGAVPKVTRVVKLPERLIDRTALRSELEASLLRPKPTFAAKMWQERAVQVQAEAVWQQLAAILTRAAEAETQDIAWIHEVHAFLGCLEEKSPIMAAYLFGTLLLCLGSVHWYEARIRDAEQRCRYRRLALDRYRELVATMEERFTGLMEEIEALVEGRLDPMAGLLLEAGREAS